MIGNENIKEDKAVLWKKGRLGVDFRYEGLR